MTSSIISSINMKELQDNAPPTGAFLSGSYIRSFAYKTIKDRLPIIVTGVIDRMSRNKESIIQKYGPNSSDELKQVIGDLSQLRSELMTNKPLNLLNLTNSEKDRDAAIWNKYIKNIEDTSGAPPTWYNAVWLFSECYMYRRISQIFTVTHTLSAYDPFENQKHESFATFHRVIDLVAKYIINIANETNNSSDKCQENLINLLKLNLWGNRCDLSLSGGSIDAHEGINPIEQLKMFDKYILIDDSVTVWNLLNKQSVETKNQDVIIDIVLDNAGYELFTDMCLAVFLMTKNLAQKIRFYVKSIPWFISDTMKKDFIWLIDNMKNSSAIYVRELGEKCWNYIENGQWTIEVESFWTEPYDFSEMKHNSPELYAKLSEAKLIIFKGDLNYRKLLGDINWMYETNLATALRGFKPTNIVTLRTIKADLIVGLSCEKATELFKKQENWMTTGQYGLINSVIN
ncbi:hypothetical protein PV326_012205 [Microctonus aethiopoides]|uniref:Sugar phosphate phosphatase n=1 Tax=Microctonus aethiopoides TaxID=144406 RepID=A0AA39KQI1_9HYME|nr:hypothetical protein PV326_012205 [Microctonus aethiopoides]KAK0170049.1 hypothetical protein PV328_010660 [Microctonus aethiopoides]